MKPIACEDATTVSESAADLHAASNVSDFFDSLFALLNENSIQYCVLGSRASMSIAATETLALAVHPEHRKELPRLFYSLPREHFQPVQCFGVDSGTDHFHFALLDGSRPQLLRVEVLYLRCGARLMAFQDEIFVRRQWQGNCWVAAPVDQFSYLLAKIRRTGAFTNPEEESLKLLVENVGREEAERVAGKLYGCALRTEVVTACTTGSLRAKLQELRSPLWHNSLPRWNVDSALDVIRKKWQLLYNWFHPSGLLITILGPDGAGKTTMSAKIFAALGPAFGPQKLLLWRPEVLPRLSQNPSPLDLPHSKPPRGAMQSVARLLAIFLDYWVGHFLLVKPLLSRSGLILYDRDFHDILVDRSRYRYGGPSWLPRLLIQALPRTDSLFLILDAAPEVILQRKQEVSPEEVRRQLAAYRRLAEELPDSYVIRAEGDVDGSASVVAQSVVEYLGRRYQRRYVRKQTADSGPVRTKRLQAWAATARGAVADLYSQQCSWLQKGFLAVLDQGLISGSNFLLAILLARWLPVEQYGAYALSFAIFLLFSFIQQGLVLEPMSVFGPSTYRNSQREYLGTLVWLQGALAAVFIAPVAVAATIYTHGDSDLFQMTLLGMFFSAPCVLLYWFARRAFYLQLQPGGAVGGAMLYCALLAVSVWLLVRTHRLSAFTAFLAIGVAALIVSVGQLWQVRPILLRKKAYELQEVGNYHWRYGRWAMLSFLFIWIPWNIYYPVLGHFAGLTEVAGLRALLNLALPVTQALSAFTLLFLPHASHVSQQESWAGAKGLALRITAFFAFGTAMYWLPVCLFRAPLLQFLYAGHYSNIARLVPWIALSSFMSGLALGPAMAFRAMRSPATVSLAYFVSSGVTLVFGIPATHFFGISGAVVCNLLSSIIAAVLGWILLARHARQGMGSRLMEQEAVL
jgi:O-antigen/teichoic acid export membrane protein/thymidylate kinase